MKQYDALTFRVEASRFVRNILMATASQDDVTIFDGGMGHLIKQKELKLASLDGQQCDKYFLVGAYANVEQPSVVEALHLEFINAGATVITTNSFAATPWALTSIGKEADLELLLQAAANVAQEAAAKAKKPVQVAGCLPPLKDSYQTVDLGTAELMQPTYMHMAATLEPLVDLFLCETLSSTAETMAAASAASMSGKPFWVSWSLEDSEHALLRSGESLQDAVKLVQDLPGLQAMLLNCCAPQAITAAMPKLRGWAPPHVQVGASANGFKTTTTEWLGGGTTPGMIISDGDYDADDIITPEAYARHAKQWKDLGATIIGGCCAVGPDHIKHLSSVIK
ncbi:hypothetical protein ABBQ38_006150 [Trebouxia sp. C0009 RCD-2024]